MLRKKLFTLFLIIPFVTTSKQANAIPFDWNGVVGYDTVMIQDYRRTDTHGNYAANGGQTINEPSGNPDDAKFQSYTLKLRPSIIVNDSASIFAELTTGYAKGGYFGGKSKQDANSTSNFGNALYNYSTINNDTISLTRLYTELYSDTATYVVGRMPMHWGLGAVFNEGKGATTRHASIEDGIMAKFVIGSFNISPFWTKINSTGSVSSQSDMTAFGAELLYDNTEQDMSFGVLLSKRKIEADNTTVSANVENTGSLNLAASAVTIVDLFFEKSFGKFKIAAEVPIIEGDFGRLYSSNSGTVSYKASAIMAEASYTLSNRWKFGLWAGTIDGHDGGTGSYKALFLNPNYQIANLMFRYNLDAVADTNQSIFDSYMTNTKYVRLDASYTTNKWIWNAAFIYAVANEVATNGKSFYKHETNTIHTASANQEKDLGYEIDLGFDYNWNSNILIEGDLGYHFVGSYYEFTNSATKQATTNSLLASLKLSLNF